MKITAILVVYNCTIDDSKTYISLLKNHMENPVAFNNFRLIIYDNSPRVQQIPDDMPFACRYIHDPGNGGVAAAYNQALKESVGGTWQWLLLLDQDTGLPEKFLYDLYRIAAEVDTNDQIAAIVPKVFHGGRFFSPSKVLFGGVQRPIDINHEGICEDEIAAIGSAALLRVSFLRRIGGFNKTYWLDCMDRWIFHVIYASGCKAYVSGARIEHDLSIMNYDKSMTEARYGNIIQYETLFMKSYKSKSEYYFYLLRLLRRSLIFLFTVKDKSYSAMTFRHLIGLIFPR